jgi:hypothetical protein
METIIPRAAYEPDGTGFEGFLDPDDFHILNQRLELDGRPKETKTEFPMELAVTAIEDDQESYYSAFIRDISSRVSGSRNWCR